jgi:glycosyltransferase involved in cell wall biosynthesis
VPLRVLLISPSFVGYGGIEAFVLHLAAFLQRQPGLELRVCLKVAGQYGHPEPLHEAIRQSGIKVEWVQRGSWELLRLIAWADLLHVQNAPPDILLPAWVMRKPIVLTIHNQLKGRLSLHGRLWRLGARLAKRRWYNSNYVRGTWHDTAASPHSRRVPTVCQLPEGSVASELRRGLVFVSRLVKGKGAETLVEAYRRSGLDPVEWPLHLIGSGPLCETLRALAIPGVVVHGFVSEAEKGRLVRSARWMVAVPDVPEDMGLTPIEARAVGVPCVVSSEGGLPEVGGRFAILSPPGQPERLAEVLSSLAKLSEAEYLVAAAEAKEGLDQLLMPLSFYPEEYKNVMEETTLKS